MPQYAKAATPVKRKFVRSRTPKRAKEEREYNRQVKIWKQSPDNKYCFACRPVFDRWPYSARDCHHWAGRQGDLLLYKPFWKPVCSQCHAFISNNIAKAIELGLRAPKHQWNQMPKTQP
jgi:hypothetical protein